MLAGLLAVLPGPTTTASAASFTYDAPRAALDVVRDSAAADAGLGLLSDGRQASAAPSVEGRGPSTTLSAGSVATEAAGTGGIETTAHGATRIAGEAATRGGVLSEAEIGIVREAGTVYNQSNGALARVLQQADGRFSVVVDGDRGLITTFQNLSQSSLDRLAKNYGWELP